MSSYWFQFLSIDLAPIKKQSSDGVSCPGCLHRGGRHIQEVLEHTKTKKKAHEHMQDLVSEQKGLKPQRYQQMQQV